MQRALALDASLPLSFSLRFFITAPLFVIFAAFILLVAGPQALSSRWHPAILAITHLLVLGTLAQTMIGALLQILPVATGITVFQSRPLGHLIHISLNAGTRSEEHTSALQSRGHLVCRLLFERQYR